MSILENLQERKRKVAKQIADLHKAAEEGGKWESEEREKFDALTADFDMLDEEVKAEEARADKLAQYQEYLDQQQEWSDKRAEVFGEKRVNVKAADEEYEERFTAMLKAPRLKAKQIAEDPEFRTLGAQVVGTSGYGGVLVPTRFQTEILEGIKAFGGLRQVARVIRTNSGGTLRWPIVDDVANMAVKVAENTANTTSTPVSFNVFELGSYKYTSKPILITREMAQDGVINVADYVRDALTTRFGRGTENAYANSTAAPAGLITLTASTAWVAAHGTKVTAGTSNITPEHLIGLQHDVDPGYRVNGSYMFRDELLEVIRKLRFGTSGPFVWQPSYQAGVPDKILGKPYVVNNSLSTATFQAGSSGDYWCFFGDWSRGFYIHDCLPITIRLLTERYADQDANALLGFMRTDCKPASTTLTEYPLACLWST